MHRITRFLLTLTLASLPAWSAAALWDFPDAEQDGWKKFDWYGWIFDTGNGWVYHTDHGWTYAMGETASSVWFYDEEMGWVWSGEGIYPYLYTNQTSAWLYFQEGTHEPRFLYHFSASDWVSLHLRNPEPVQLFPDTYDWRHREFFESAEHELLGTTRNVVTTQFETQVIENDLIRVTLLPGWGARILSIFYKPFNCELLSYTRAGNYSDVIYAPGAFYYDDWLLLPGGINPTFPEGEHGKYWGLPWAFSTIEEAADRITVRMSRADDIDWAGTPGKFNNGLTEMIADMDITIHRNRACVEITYTLTNTKSETIPYEFWMAAALAPSTPDVQFVSGNLEIVMNQEKMLLRDYWNWMEQTETDDETPNDDVYLFDKLAWLQNWKGSGIAYAYPLRTDPWWGVINHDNLWGVLRTADDPDGSPGMKLWGTGADYGMFELWSGNSREFFTDAFLAPNEVKTWKEYFIPTIDLSGVSNANNHGAVQASVTNGADSESIDLSVFSTWQPANWQLEIFTFTGTETRQSLSTAALSFSSTAPTQHLVLVFPNENLPQEPFIFECVLTDLFSGEERLRLTIDR